MSIIKWIDLFSSTIILPEDSPKEILHKRFLIYMSILMSMGGVVWGSLLIYFKIYSAVLIPFGYTYLTVVNYTYLLASKKFSQVRFFQVLISLTLPFALQWSLGGFQKSGMVMYWSVLSVLGTFAFNDAKKTIPWIFSFVALTIFSSAYDAEFAANSPPISASISPLLFGLNISLVSVTSFLLVYFFVHQHEVAIHEAREAESKIANNEKLAILGELSAGIAHEINNPLTIILGNAEILKKMISDPELQKRSPERIFKLAETIEHTTQRIARIVKALLTFAREHDRDVIDEIKLKSLITDAVAISQERLRTRGIEVKIEIPESMTVRSNSMSLGQVILNLLSNSIFAIENLAKKWIHIQAVPIDDGMIEIWFTDSGNGIQKEIREKIMRPFFTTKPVGVGTGLGLSISKGFIEQHGGRLVIDEKCANTRFIITLPSSSEEQGNTVNNSPVKQIKNAS